MDICTILKWNETLKWNENLPDITLRWWSVEEKTMLLKFEQVITEAINNYSLMEEKSTIFE